MLASSRHRAIEPPSRQSIEPPSSLHRACIELQHRASIELSASSIEAGAQGETPHRHDGTMIEVMVSQVDVLRA
jgi:hypothetical protein